ncbi:MAG: hypothetical protein QXJ59_08930 [Thermofilaceae archaeon]
MLSGLPDFIDPSLPLDVEPRDYTTEEFLKMAEEGRGVVSEILAYGEAARWRSRGNRGGPEALQIRGGGFQAPELEAAVEPPASSNTAA